MGIAKKEQQITFYDLQNLGAHKLEISTAFVKSLKVSFSQQHLFWGEVLHVLVSVSDSQLKILTAFARSLKVSFTLHLFQCEVFIIMYMFWSQSQIHKQGSWDLGESLILPSVTTIRGFFMSKLSQSSRSHARLIAQNFVAQSCKDFNCSTIVLSQEIVEKVC